MSKGNCRELMLRACSGTDTPWRDAPLLHGVNFDSAGNLTTLTADVSPTDPMTFPTNATFQNAL